MKNLCLEHERNIGEMESQLNGKGGIADRIGQMEQKVDSLHTKLTFGIGFLAALQILVPIVAPHVANAFFSINNPLQMPKLPISQKAKDAMYYDVKTVSEIPQIKQSIDVLERSLAALAHPAPGEERNGIMQGIQENLKEQNDRLQRAEKGDFSGM